jgi:hypothetical protein
MKVQAPEFGFLLDLQHPGMLGIAAARHKLPLLLYCADVRLGAIYAERPSA